MAYFLGVDVGGTKTAALIADQDGRATGYGVGGPGNYEGVGWDGFRRAVRESVDRAIAQAGLKMSDLAAAGMGIAGYDWPSQKTIHLDALREIGFHMPMEIVNDSVLGILAGAEQGWGLSVVSGTGCNCRGWSRDHRREGRMVGGYSQWSGEFAGGFDILSRAMRAVVFEWNRRGPATALSDLFLEVTGAGDLDDLVEGLYVSRYHPWDRSLVLRVFEVAHGGDQQALSVLRWAGSQLGELACGVIHQLEIQAQAFDIVLIGSIFKGHPAIAESLADTVHPLAPRARLVHLGAPPVMGGVLLGMEQASLDGYPQRERLIATMMDLMPPTDKNLTKA